MKSQRQLQFGEQIKRAISDIFLREGLMTVAGSYVTILEADSSPDLKNVRIFVDIFGNVSNNKKIMAQLNQAAPYFRHEIGKKISTRNTPEICFILDETQKNALAIESLIDKESAAMAAINKQEIKSVKKPRKKN